ncbi:MAG: ATP-dependent DNA helicase RecG [Planctomycetes bacterium]|nr:ATP-dependent DNA helicase RecG [Planctomycetota bacterium]
MRKQILPIDQALRIPFRRRQALERLGLKTLGDLIRHLPRRYEDRRHLKTIRALEVGERTTVWGRILAVRQRQSRTGKTLIEACLGDDTGEIQLVWFQQAYLLEVLKPGATGYFYGEVKLRRRLQMLAPEFELEEAEDEESEPAGRSETAAPSGSGSPPKETSVNLRRIVPIYPATQGLSQRILRRWMAAALSSGVLDELEEGPHALLAGRGATLKDAYQDVHFPEDGRALKEARERLAFEEYFWFASQLHLRRRRFRAAGGRRLRAPADLDQKIRSVLPFQLTGDQNRVIEEIVQDLQGEVPMYRLLEGDVGTGKTAIALYALLVAVRNGCQGALMAPTEVLAEQHHRHFLELLRQHPALKIDLLTGSIPPPEKSRILENLAAGKTHIAVGTHALIQEGVRFKALGVAVIDEQHRFGVRERARLRQKGEAVHLLVMSATPIPRSLCLTVYGDLDLSILRERPPGRAPVRTFLVPPAKKSRALEFISRELDRGRQAYFIYPIIEESEALEVPAATEAHQRLEQQFHPHRIGLLHGRLSADEKENCLRQFRDHRFQILVSTLVVEVGIDVPNATVLFIEDASRFGLAQLHQLRGRVGRGDAPGTCFVGLGKVSEETRRRLEVLAQTEDGFRIAEEDLRLRGPGDFLGVRQSGWPHFRIGNPLADLERFQSVQKLAERFWEEPDFAGEARRYLERHPELADPGVGDEEEDRALAALD